MHAARNMMGLQIPQISDTQPFVMPRASRLQQRGNVGRCDFMTFCSSVLGTNAVDVATVAVLWQDTCQVLVHVVITK